MGAVATAFTNAFPNGSNIAKSDCRALGATIETYVSAPFTLNYNAAASPTSAPTGYIQRLIGKDADTYQMLVIDGFGGAPTARLRRANGTGAAPTAVVANDVVGRLEYTGYYTTGGTTYATNPASIRGIATENWSSTAQGSQVVVATTPNTTATPADALFIGQDQSVLAVGNLGYVTGKGAGGTVTQATSRTTGVTLNAVTGQITLFNGAGSSLGQTFTLSNSKIKSTSNLHINIAGSPTGLYYFGVKITAGAAAITVFNPGNNSEAPVLQFAIIDCSAN